MAELKPIITIRAQLPQNIVRDPRHDLNSAEWEWVNCLKFPINKLNDLQLSSRPYKWIRFCTGIVLGARGHLCTQPDLPHPVPIDYDSGLPATSVDLYYYTSDEEKLRMFPIDPKLTHTRTVTSSRTSTRRGDFRDDVKARDEKCVVTGVAPRVSDAAHLLPHSKGDTV